jgi:hypothetical protein
MTLPIPVPLPPYTKWITILGPIAARAIYELVTYLNQDNDPAQLEWRRLMVRYENDASTALEDDAYVSFDLVNITGGDVDTTWNDADFVACEESFDTFFNANKDLHHDKSHISQYKWYRRRFAPYSEQDPFQDSGPPVRVVARTYTGTQTSYTPPQVALSVTEKTPWPRHWGRFYLPAIGGIWVANTLRPGGAQLSTVATRVKTLYDSLMADEMFPVIPVTQLEGDPFRALLGVNAIQLDDIFDVIRRRRFANPTVRNVLPLP